MNPFLFLGLHIYALGDRLLLRQHPPLGTWGERWAARYLRLKGCHILGMNVRPCRRGELDIIAKKGQVYLFVEVKTRKNEAYGAPITAIHARKRHHLRRCATHWLAQHRLLDDRTLYRFDAIEVIGTPGTCPRIRHTPGIDMTATRAPDL